MHRLARLDQHYVWHPFTQMRDWLRHEPTVIVRGKGAMLEDVNGRRYLDANSSIWTNLHGHNHPRINAAIRRQLGRISHSSALGLANEPAGLLAEQLINAANSPFMPRPTRGQGGSRSRTAPQGGLQNPRLTKTFFSDDGSTAMETALKMAYEYARRSGLSGKPRFLSLAGGYHGDTVGAVSLGHIDLFHKTWTGLLFKTDRVMSPYCYRCPFNRAKPDRADARDYRKCNWECIDEVEQWLRAPEEARSASCRIRLRTADAGCCGIDPPAPRLAAARRGDCSRPRKPADRGRGDDRLRKSCTASPPAKLASGTHGRQMLLERENRRNACATLFASHPEGVQPDLIALAKGLTGGYLPDGGDPDHAVGVRCVPR